jgi:hypothetical protein
VKKWFKKNLANKFRAPRISSFKDFDYRTGTIITHGLYLLNPLFEGKNHFSRRFFEKIAEINDTSYKSFLKKPIIKNQITVIFQLQQYSIYHLGTIFTI